MSRSITTMRCSKSTDMRRRSSASTLMPARSIVQQHRQQPPLHLLIQRQRGVEAQPRPQRLPQAQRHIGVFGRIGGGALDRHLRNGMRLRPVPVISS